MKDWFEKLESRERLLVSIAGVMVAAALLYLLILQPLYGGAAETAGRVDDKRELLAWIQRAAQEVGADTSSTASPVASDQSLVVIVDRTSRRADLAGALKRNQPAGENGIRVRFEDAPFDNMIAWLGTLQRGHGLQIVSATFDRGTLPGTVNASLSLERPQ